MKSNKRVAMIILLISALIIIMGVCQNYSYVIWKGWGPLHRDISRPTEYGYKSSNPLQPAINAYNVGKYKDAEAASLRVIDSSSKSTNPAVKKDAVRARYVLAFSAARRKDMKEAQARFAVLRDEASKLPDKGKQDASPGQMEPTLTEEGAYQHAVCTAALGDKKAAEEEYLKFMRDYPESPLINGCVMRIERLHGGHPPKYAEDAWQQAQKVAMERQKTRQKEQSMCGPECLAELLRRKGEKADVKTLAKEMKTSETGTSLQSLAETAKKHGYTPKGLQLTPKGLNKQKLPLIAIIMPGHFVIVEKANLLGVTIWDPNGAGQGKPSTRHFSNKEWKRMWGGIALCL